MQEKGRREALVGQICLIVFWHSLDLQTAQNIDTLLILGGFFWTVYTILQDKLLDLWQYWTDSRAETHVYVVSQVMSECVRPQTRHHSSHAMARTNHFPPQICHLEIHINRFDHHQTKVKLYFWEIILLSWDSWQDLPIGLSPYFTILSSRQINLRGFLRETDRVGEIL